MRKTLLAFSVLALLLLGGLILGASLDAVQADLAARGPRPTPTPEGPGEPFSPSKSPDVPPLPDLVVESIEVLPAVPLINQRTTVLVTIKNQGSIDVDPTNNFWADLYIDPAVVPIQLGQDGVVDWGCQGSWMGVGDSYILAVTLPPPDVFTNVKTYALYAQVDTDAHVAEENENNNVLGPIQVEVRSREKMVYQTHEELQNGLASGLDISHPDGVIRRGLFDEPVTEPEIYWPDTMINDITGTVEGGELLPTTVNQLNPSLTGDGAGTLFAAWTDGRNGGQYNRDIYFSRSDDDGDTWGPDVRVNDDPIANTVNQQNPALAYNATLDRLYAAWQDEREDIGQPDIFFAYSDDGGNTWSANQKISDAVPATSQTNPSIAIGPSGEVYVVWQDNRNANLDVYLTRSDDDGASWTENHFVTDDPGTTSVEQSAPSVAVDAVGMVFVCWEDWRVPDHPEIYVANSDDGGATFDVDVPVTIPGGTSYRLAPSIAVNTVITEPEVLMTDIHVAWQQGQGEQGDVHWAYSILNYVEPEPCPPPYVFCFNPPQQASGFVIDSEYVMPPDPGPTWPISPSWQGQVALAPASTFDWTWCHADSIEIYRGGAFLVWSDAQSYDDWRYELHTRRVASKDLDVYELCEDQATGVVNDNVKLYAYRNNLELYETMRPAATSQFNVSIFADPPPSPTFLPRVHLAWDDDRWDKPLEPLTVRNRDIFYTKMGYNYDEGIYISPALDSKIVAIWYTLSWWGATASHGDLLLQTRFGNTPYPPQEDVATSGWTRWTGNPSSDYLGCDAGEGCYYDAPGRTIVGPDGTKWPESRYVQVKVTIRGYNRITALSQITLHYEGPTEIYLPVILRNP